MGDVEKMLKDGQSRVRFHMPGHMGRIPLGQYDTTELASTDDLHQPTGPYARLQERFAAKNGAQASFLLVGGSTLGVQAMLLACLRPGDALLLPRSAHVSAWSACVIGGFRPQCIYPTYDAERGLALYREEDVLAAMEQTPDARALLLVRPDYYGRCLPLERIARRAREKGMLLLVDEAHGAHLPFLQAGPRPAGALGADLWCQSLHKTLPALTQTAVLHLRDARQAPRVRAALRLLETSSPSSLLLLSAEKALDWMERWGGERLEWLAERISRLEQELDGRYRLCRFANMDPTRLVLDVRGTGNSGYAVARSLAEAGVDMEMADDLRLVGIPSVMSREEDFACLAAALGRLAGSGQVQPPKAALRYGQPCMDLREAFFCEKRLLPLERAAGQICGAAFGPYPPGEPLAVPGERISQALVQGLLDALERGCGSFGITNKGEVSCVIAP